MNTLVSIIVPIYKSEAYIERCVRSLMEQTMKTNIEFVFINDCTPDHSMEIFYKIIKEYPSRKDQIIILENKKNLGISETRKIALNKSSGSFIGWCDSDDWIEKDTYQKMWQSTNNGKIDIVVINYILEEDNSGKIIIHNNSNSPQFALENSWKKNYLPLGLPFQLIRKSLLEYAINKIIPTSQGEDTYMMRYIYSKADSIKFIPDILYHYDRTNISSITHNTALTQQQWELHKQNIDNITALLLNRKSNSFNYRKSINHLKYIRKYQFRNIFGNIISYYFTYRECYRDINYILDNNSKTKLRTYLIYNCFPLFWMYFHKTWNK